MSEQLAGITGLFLGGGVTPVTQFLPQPAQRSRGPLVVQPLSLAPGDGWF